jgi:predicted GIY-YIG superfamily endonuclease
MSEIRDTYKYVFKVGNLQVHCGITDNLARREQEHRNSGRYTIYNNVRYYWSEGHISQVGNITTREAALQWERENGCNG